MASRRDTGDARDDGDMQVEGSRRLAFASPLNNYSPPVRFTYDPARQPAKSLLTRQGLIKTLVPHRHSLPPAEGVGARLGHAHSGLSSWMSHDVSCVGPDDSAMLDSPDALVAHSQQMFDATAKMLGAWQRSRQRSAGNKEAAPMPTAAEVGPDTNGWEYLLGRFCCGGLISFDQFLSALVARDEQEVSGLTDMRDDADDLWTALVGDRASVGNVSEIAELLTVACSERNSERAATRAAPNPTLRQHSDIVDTGDTGTGKWQATRSEWIDPTVSSRHAAPQNPEMMGDEDMCNIETDSLDGNGEPNTEEDKELHESMQRLRRFIGTQPRASGEAIESLEVFLAKDSSARDLTLPSRPAMQPAHLATFSSVITTRLQHQPQSPQSQKSQQLSQSERREESGVTPLLQHDPSPSRWLEASPVRGMPSPKTPSASDPLRTSHASAKTGHAEGQSSRTDERERREEISSAIAAVGEEASEMIVHIPRMAELVWSPSSAGGISIVSPQPAAPPQPHIKTPQHSSPLRTTPQRSAAPVTLAAHLEVDSPGSCALQEYTRGATVTGTSEYSDIALAEGDSSVEDGEEGGAEEVDRSFSLEAPLTAWGADDLDREAVLARLRERQSRPSASSARLGMVKMLVPQCNVGGAQWGRFKSQSDREVGGGRSEDDGSELEARILSRLEKQREEEEARAMERERENAVAALEGEASLIQAWARVSALEEGWGGQTRTNTRDGEQSSRPSRLGVLLCEGGGGEGFSAQVAAIVAGLHDLVSNVRSSHEAAVMREIPDDQLLVAAARADPFAPEGDEMHNQAPLGILRNSGALWEEVLETPFEDPSARPEAYPIMKEAGSPISSLFRSQRRSPRNSPFGGRGATPTQERNTPKSVTAVAAAAAKGRTAWGGRLAEARDHFNTPHSPFASISPKRQRGAQGALQNRNKQRSPNGSPHSKDSRQGGAARAVAETVSSISQWRPKTPTRNTPTHYHAIQQRRRTRGGEGASEDDGEASDGGGGGGWKSQGSSVADTPRTTRSTSRTRVPNTLSPSHSPSRPSPARVAPATADEMRNRGRARERDMQRMSAGNSSGAGGVTIVGTGGPLRRAAKEPHTLSDACPDAAGNAEAAAATAARGSSCVGVAEGVAARPVNLSASGQASAHTLSLTPSLFAVTPHSALSPVGEWETKYQPNSSAEFAAPAPATEGGGQPGEWESPRMAPPLPTRFSPAHRRSSEEVIAARRPPHIHGAKDSGVGGEQWVPPSPLVRAKDHLMTSFLSASTPVRGSGGGSRWVEPSPQPRSSAPAPLAMFGVQEKPKGEGAGVGGVSGTVKRRKMKFRAT